MNRLRTLLLILGLLGTGPFASAQMARGLQMPAQVDMTRSGWDVTLQNGNLTFGLPLAVVPGEVPIPVSFGLNATYSAIQSRINFPLDQHGHTYERVEIDRPMAGGLHFGYLADGGTYGAESGATVQGLTVLETGVQIADNQWQAFSSVFGTLLNLPRAYGFGAVSADVAKVDPSGTYLTFTTPASGLDSTSQNLLQNLSLAAFGVGNTSYRVVMDKDKARIYGNASCLQGWVPLLWLDRFHHYVTFQWQRSAAPTGSTATAINQVTASNQRGKGVVVQWAEFPVSAYKDETDLLRVDFFGMYGPSVYLKGYPGYASAAPKDYAASFTYSTDDGPWMVAPGIRGACFRPTSIQVGPYESIPKPAWAGPGRGAPPADGTLESPARTWTLAYDDNGAELTSITEPSLLCTHFTYKNYAAQTTNASQPGVN